ncbi:MAG: carboxymuconolactone decarboxylase family protein [Ekhidna sp.]|nr:carboxymuconolactone decarboxylase family protein [Ekhidna sp.]
MKQTKRGFNLEIKEDLSPEIREVFEWYVENFQFVPNLSRVMSEAPALLRSYWQTQLNLLQMGTLTPEENNVVQMSIAVENKCRYCASGHIMAGRMVFGSSEEVMANIIEESNLPEARLNALRDFALAVYEGKGSVSAEAFSSFKAAGYSNAQALDVVTNISTKVMSNFTNQLTNNELDEVLEPLAAELSY